MIGGDSGALRALAGRVRDASAEIDEAAGRVRSVESIQWRSTAADRFRETLEQRATEFREVVSRYDALAGRLDHLASTLDAGVDAAWGYADDIAGFARDHLGWLR